MRTSMMSLALASLLVAQDGDKAKQEHTILTAEDVKWGDGPATLPPGAKAAVLDGDPKKEGVFTMRLKVPGGYKVPPHWHGGYERLTVVSGAFHLGLGEKFDESKARKLPAGAYFSLPPKTAHFAYTTEETVVQISTMGPWTLTYVDPKDDPRASR